MLRTSRIGHCTRARVRNAKDTLPAPDVVGVMELNLGLKCLTQRRTLDRLGELRRELRQLIKEHLGVMCGTKC